MNLPYLTPDLKDYYLDQMEKCCQLRSSSNMEVLAWAMDERLEESMNRINCFGCLQTMLSLFPRTPHEAKERVKAGAALMYIHVAYADYAEDSLRAAVESRQDSNGSLVITAMPAEPQSFPEQAFAGDLAALRDIDAAANQAKYLAVKNVLLFAEPSVAVMRTLIHMNSDKLLKALRETFEELVQLLECVGVECEGQPLEAVTAADGSVLLRSSEPFDSYAHVTGGAGGSHD